LIVKGEELQPSLWMASYFILPPGGSLDCNVGVPSYSLKGANPVIQISEWNVDNKNIDLPY